MYSSMEPAVDLLAIVSPPRDRLARYARVSCQETPKRSWTQAYLAANG